MTRFKFKSKLVNILISHSNAPNWALFRESLTVLIATLFIDPGWNSPLALPSKTLPKFPDPRSFPILKFEKSIFIKVFQSFSMGIFYFPQIFGIFDRNYLLNYSMCPCVASDRTPILVKLFQHGTTNQWVGSFSFIVIGQFSILKT